MSFVLLGAAAALGLQQQDADELLRHFFQVLAIAIGALHHRQSPREGDRKIRFGRETVDALSVRGRAHRSDADAFRRGARTSPNVTSSGISEQAALTAQHCPWWQAAWWPVPGPSS